MLPSVNVNIEGGNLGRVATLTDGVAALVLSGVAVTGKLDLATPYQVFSLDEVEALGIDAAYDTANSTRAHEHCNAFFEEAGEGSELWIYVTSAATSLEDNVAAHEPLQAAAAGLIRLISVTRDPGAGYVPTITGSLDEDTQNAVDAAKLAAIDMAASYTPMCFLIEGRHLDDAALAGLTDQRTTTNTDGSKYVSVVLGDEASGTGSWVGRVLGRLASIPVQRSLGRVRSGALNVSSAYLGSTKLEEISQTQLGNIYDKGYIIPVRHTGQNGYYLVDDPNADLITSDFSFINRTRVIEKARLIVRGVLLQELLEEVPVDANSGRLAPSYIGELTQACDNALNAQLIDTGNASAAQTIIDPTQNILSTDKLEVTVKVTPMGTARTIEATVSFSNPAL